MKKIQQEFFQKNVAILGYGIEGKSVVDYVIHHGANHISVYDEKLQKEALDLFQGQYSPEKVTMKLGIFPDTITADIIIVSPGIRPDISLLEQARKSHIEVTTATNIFFSHCPCPIIGVTGTKGKGTTSTLIYEILKKEGRDAYLGGNIGIAPLSFVDTLRDDSIVVLELSSFQLFTLERSPHIAVVIMVTVDHLDYHRDIAEYVEAKTHITRFQKESDFAIYNTDYPHSKLIASKGQAKKYQVSAKHILSHGAYVNDGYVYLQTDQKAISVVPTDRIFIPGKHNWENVCAAAMAASCAGASIPSMKSVFETFRGLPHRLQCIEKVSGVTYYDDSFSTTPDTAIAAIDAFEAQKVLILGGSSKGSDFTQLGAVLSTSQTIRAIIGIGKEWTRIKQAIEPQALSKMTIIEGCTSMHQIVSAAAKIATSGDVVLLSPACASFDMFKNYKDRGDQFIREVRIVCGEK